MTESIKAVKFLNSLQPFHYLVCTFVRNKKCKPLQMHICLHHQFAKTPTVSWSLIFFLLLWVPGVAILRMNTLPPSGRLCFESAAGNLQPGLSGHSMKALRISSSSALSPTEHQTNEFIVWYLPGCDRCLWLRAASPGLDVALMEDLGEQLGGLMEAATQLIQLLLHGEDPLLQLPVWVVPIGTEVAHDHLHLLIYSARPQLSVGKNLSKIPGILWEILWMLQTFYFFQNKSKSP